MADKQLSLWSLSSPKSSAFLQRKVQNIQGLLSWDLPTICIIMFIMSIATEITRNFPLNWHYRWKIEKCQICTKTRNRFAKPHKNAGLSVFQAPRKIWEVLKIMISGSKTPWTFCSARHVTGLPSWLKLRVSWWGRGGSCNPQRWRFVEWCLHPASWWSN